MEESINAAIRMDAHKNFNISWDQLVTETAKDPSLSLLLKHIQSGFESILPDKIAAISDYWRYVILYAPYMTFCFIRAASLSLNRFVQPCYLYFTQRIKEFLQCRLGL